MNVFITVIDGRNLNLQAWGYFHSQESRHSCILIIVLIIRIINIGNALNTVLVPFCNAALNLGVILTYLFSSVY